MLEEEDDGVERLILCRRRGLPLEGQVGQKRFDLGAAHAAGVPEWMEPDECYDPPYISLFRPIGIVRRSDLRADLIWQSHGLIMRSAIHAR